MRVADAMITAPKLCDARTTVGEVRALFRDTHVHAALVVQRAVLVTVIEPADLRDVDRDDAVAASLGTLAGRVVPAGLALGEALELMRADNRRRLAVVGADGQLTGLLCLKSTRSGFCSAADVQARSEPEHLVRALLGRLDRRRGRRTRVGQSADGGRGRSSARLPHQPMSAES